MPSPERGKIFSKEQIFERGIHEDDVAQVVGGVIEMLLRYRGEKLSEILLTAAIKIESEYSYRAYEEMGSSSQKIDDISDSGRESVKSVARLFRKLEEKYKLLYDNAPPDERDAVRVQLISELSTLRATLHQKRMESISNYKKPQS